jgi:hypothetical protein
MSDEPAPKSDNIVILLVLAFLPSAMLLAFIGVTNGGRSNLLLGPMLTLACFVSVVCCFGSAFMLFKRKSWMAIFAGIVFLLLNGAISFLFGCGAILTQLTP